MISAINNLINKIVKHYSKNTYNHKKVRLVLMSVLVTALFGFFYVGQAYMLNSPEGVSAMLFLGCIFLFVFPFLFLLRIPLLVIGNLFLLIGWGCEYYISWYTGGLNSPVLPWVASVPIAALLLTNRKWAWIWLVVVSVSIIYLYVKSSSAYIFPKNYDLQLEALYFTSSYAGLAFICLVLNQIFEGNLNTANEKLEISNKQLAEQRKTSDNLLLNILPATIAEELKTDGKAKARSYESATILFADIKDFTKIAENMSADQLVYELDILYSGFDRIVKKHDVEKIKTVGDAYICASGLPLVTETHAEVMITVACEMQEFMQNYLKNIISDTNSNFELRIGINSGHVVAGVVGTNKFAYDIWGDAVNIAARMEQNSEPGKINISQSTYDLVKHCCDCDYRGKIYAKNKGEIDMYFVDRIKDNPKNNI